MFPEPNIPQPNTKPGRIRCKCGQRFGSMKQLNAHIATEPAGTHGHAKPPEQLSRPARWSKASGQLADAVETLSNANASDFSEADWNAALVDASGALSELRDLQDEYNDWQSNLPESFQDGALNEKLQAIADLDLDPSTPDDCDLNDILKEAEITDPESDAAEEAIQAWINGQDASSLEDILGEVEGIDLPRGFGRD